MPKKGHRTVHIWHLSGVRDAAMSVFILREKLTQHGHAPGTRLLSKAENRYHPHQSSAFIRGTPASVVLRVGRLGERHDANL
jgi:hypothetical protein